jgi:cell division septal protein FtsQ
VAQLPFLVGQASDAATMFQFYQRANQVLSKEGLKVKVVRYDVLGSWFVRLTIHTKVVLGKVHVINRLRQFVLAYPLLKKRYPDAVFQSVDMRYHQGLAVAFGKKTQKKRVKPDST